MIKKNLFVLFVFYFFVVQIFIAGVLWNQKNLFILAAINLVAMVLVSLAYKFFTKSGDATKKTDTLLLKEKVTCYEQEPNAEKLIVTEETKVEAVHPVVEEEQTPISESNIEYIKTKINHTKKKPLAEGSGLYRLIMFLLAVIGLGGILYMLRDTFDFLSVIVGSIGMMIFLTVIFKVANLWRKSMFASGYFLFFLILLIASIAGYSLGHKYEKIEDIKDQITLFIEGVKGREAPQPDITDPDGYLFEQTGDVISMNLSGTAEDTDTGSGLIVIPPQGENEIGLSGDQETELSSGVDQVLSEDAGLFANEDPTKELTMIEAIKYLFTKNNISLSESQNVSFRYIAKTDANYPYMKTALEKRLIGSTTNPDLVVSCDVYMVMKGLVEGRSVKRTADIKADYRNVATSKNILNGCQKGAKLTIANL